MTDSAQISGVNFDGLEVVAFESRRAQEMATMISKLGGTPRIAPALREVLLEENAPAFAFGDALLAGGLNAVIFMTGVGARRLLEVLETRHDRGKIVAALSALTVVARGPKPVKVLREFKIPVTILVPEPNTWHEVLEELDENAKAFTLTGSRVAVQEYGVPNEEFLAALKERGVDVMRVPVYQWTLPLDIQPLRDAVQALVDGRSSVALFTNSAQVEHLLHVAAATGLKTQLLQALPKVVVASVGPTCSEMLRGEGIAIDFEPSHPKLGPMVQETAQFAKQILKQKADGAKKLADASANTEVSEIRTVTSQALERPPWYDSLFMKACRFEAVEATPVWLMRQAGRYMKEYRELRARVRFLELCKDPALVSEVTVSAAQKLGVDAAIIFADLLLIVEPLGLHLEYETGEGPVISPGLRTAADIDRLKVVSPLESLGYFYDAIRQTRSDLDSKLPLIGFAGCPFTLASYLIEGGGSKNYRQTKALMYGDPGAWKALMERLAQALALYINAQIDAGVQAIQVFDTWVGCLGPDDYRDYAQPYTKMMLQAVKPGVPIIHFGTGTAMLLEAMRDAGGDVMGIDSHVELDEAWRRLGDGVCVQGNLDPVVLYADQNFIRKRVRRVLNQAGYRTGHIFNLGHGLLPDTPYDNVVALVKMVHDISSYHIAKGHRRPRIWKASKMGFEKN